jgi:uncharacterized protein involved in exopolysaccharide biosynthesis
MFAKEPAAVPVPANIVPAVRQQNEQLALLNRQIDTTETTLEQMRRVYTPNYPDVRNAESNLAILKQKRDDLLKVQQDEQAKEQAKEQARLAEAEKNQQPVKRQMTYAEARTYQDMQSGIENEKNLIKQNEMQAAKVQKDLAATQKDIDDYQARLKETSGIEAGYNEMIESQRLATQEYQRLQAQQQLTQQNNALLERKAGENLDIIDPPSLPVQPTSPKRWLIIGAGTAISFILGLALAGVQEAKDTSLKNLKDVRAYTNLPVLSSIPLLENTMVVRRKRRIAYLAWSAAVIVGMLAVSAALYYHATTTI